MNIVTLILFACENRSEPEYLFLEHYFDREIPLKVRKAEKLARSISSDIGNAVLVGIIACVVYLQSEVFCVAISLLLLRFLFYIRTKERKLVPLAKDIDVFRKDYHEVFQFKFVGWASKGKTWQEFSADAHKILIDTAGAVLYYQGWENETGRENSSSSERRNYFGKNLALFFKFGLVSENKWGPYFDEAKRQREKPKTAQVA